MVTESQEKNLKPRPTAKTVFTNVFVAIISILAFRWLFFEMFLIPSGSMYPHLFVRDYIVATKSDFGIRLPFSQKWLYGPGLPERGEVVIFKSLDDSKFIIKRVLGLPGDKLKIDRDFILSINDKPVERTTFTDDEKAKLAAYMEIPETDFSAYKEKLPEKEITVLTNQVSAGEGEAYEVPEGNLLVMGDNRHQSYDGRYFGYLPVEQLIGKARYIVFSCGKYNPGTTSCDMKSLRLDRFGKSIRD